MRPRQSILRRLLLAYLLPTLLLLGVLGYYTQFVARRSLEEELGQRLMSIAEAAAAQVDPEQVRFLTAGDEGSRTYANLRRRLESVQRRTGVSRIYLFDQELRSRCDSEPGVAIGSYAYRLDANRAELRSVLRRGEASASVLFAGKDGVLYKSGYAPLRDRGGQVIAAVGVDASADFFDRLIGLRRYAGVAAALFLAIVLVSVAMARRITRPVSSLVAAAQALGRGAGGLAGGSRGGSLGGDASDGVSAGVSDDAGTGVSDGGEAECAVPVVGDDEISFLTRTFNEMSASLRARDQRMQMMLAGIAHEVRNPLAGIELFAGLLREELAGQPDKLAHLARIEKELGHLKLVVVDFLDYARRARSEPCDVDCAALVSEVGELFAPECAAAGVDFAARVAPDQELVVRADSGQLRRALINLLKNALQAASGHGEQAERAGAVALDCAAGGKRVSIRVRDNGQGISPQHLPQIFTPFFTTKEKGTGLGLAFAREIVEESGGEIAVESEPGAGTTFTVLLPRRS